MALLLGCTVASGCAQKAKPGRLVKVTRFRDDQHVSRTKLPICPANEPASLAERNRIDACVRAIKSQGVAVAPDDSRPCLAATLIFTAIDTGVEGECTSYPSGWGAEAECTSRSVYQYTLKLVLIDPEDEATVLESYVVTPAGKAGFDNSSVVALCRGAFHRYPQPMRGEMVRLDRK